MCTHFGETDFYPLLSLPTYKQSIPLHLSSSYISFSSILQFSVYKFYKCFIKLSKKINNILIISKCILLRNLINYLIVFYNPILYLRILMTFYFHFNYYEKDFFPRKLFDHFRITYIGVCHSSHHSLL